MRGRKLTVIRSEESPKWKAFKEHLKLCESCRDAITETDLCLEGLDLWLDKEGIKALRDFADRPKS